MRALQRPAYDVSVLALLLRRYRIDAGNRDRRILAYPKTDPCEHVALVSGTELRAGDQLEPDGQVLRLDELERAHARSVAVVETDPIEAGPIKTLGRLVPRGEVGRKTDDGFHFRLHGTKSRLFATLADEDFGLLQSLRRNFVGCFDPLNLHTG